MMGLLQHTKQTYRRLHSKGFILPVVIVLSLAISSVSLTALQTVSNSSSTLDDQYYKSLAREAAQAGVNTATACMKAGGSLWTDAAPLTPKTNCQGLAGPTNIDYVSKNDNWQSTYVVKAPTATASTVTITAQGTVTLTTKTGTIIKTFTQTAKSTARLGGQVSKSAVSLSTSFAHVCAAAEGRAYCWGYNATGQLGNNSTTNSGSPVAVSQNTVYVPATPSIPNPCGGFSQPACTTPAKPAVPVSALAGKYVTAVAAGTDHSCAIAEGIVYCWGDNTNGELGDGTNTSSKVPVSVYMNPVDVPATPSVPNPCGGFFQPACTSPAKPAMPKSPLVGQTAVSITAGLDYTCVIAYPTGGSINNSQAYCWGLNADGQLGVNDKNNRNTPTPVYTGSGSALASKTVTQITAGDAHTCAIASDGLGACWGSDTSGQIGSDQAPGTSTGVEPSITCSNTDAGIIGTQPSSIPDIITPQAIYAASDSPLYGKKLLFINASGSYTNVLADDGRLYWWGGRPPQLAAGFIKTGYVYCDHWSYSSPPCASGQSSCNKRTFDYHTATWSRYNYDIHDRPIGPTYQDHYTCWWFFTCYDNNLLTNKQLKLVSGSANLGTFCALDIAGIAYCDGPTFNPYYGQLGDGTPIHPIGNFWDTGGNSVVRAIDQAHALAGKTITTMTAGRYGNFTCVIADQAVYCWGYNGEGEVGDGTIGANNSKNTPTPVDISGVLGKPGGTNFSNAINF
jgi:alpha-tubulin suppressor-like RCC1 family protein